MIKYKYNKFIISIILISIAYSILQNTGFYGFNIDFYREYIKPNLWYYGIRDKLGMGIATLTIFNYHLGVGVTSLFLAISSGFLLLGFFKLKSLNSYILFILFYLIILHIHPVIMSTSGAMRQGLAMSFIFLSIFFLINGKKYLSIFFILISVFLHNSGIIFFILYFISLIFTSLSKFFVEKFYLIFLFFFGIFIFFLANNFLNLLDKESRIIGGDFRFFWLCINLIYILIFFYLFDQRTSNLKKFINLFLYLHSCVALAFFTQDLYYQYERINMIIGLLLILNIGLIFNKRSSYAYYLATLSAYLFLTIFQGMYSKGLV